MEAGGANGRDAQGPEEEHGRIHQQRNQPLAERAYRLQLGMQNR